MFCFTPGNISEKQIVGVIDCITKRGKVTQVHITGALALIRHVNWSCFADVKRRFVMKTLE
jgi:hypothetical protein